MLAPAVEIGRALKPLIPLIALIGGFKLGKGLLKVINFAQSGGAKQVAGVAGMARGGMVPGAGSGDTVPAMLTPGEFVVRKSAVQAFGAQNLGKINKYAHGGTIKRKQSRQGINSSKVAYTDVDSMLSAGQIDAPRCWITKGHTF